MYIHVCKQIPLPTSIQRYCQYKNHLNQLLAHHFPPPSPTVDRTLSTVNSDRSTSPTADSKRAFEIQACTWFHECQSFWTAPNHWLSSVMVSAVSFSFDCMWIAHLQLPAYHTYNLKRTPLQEPEAILASTLISSLQLVGLLKLFSLITRMCTL